MDTTDDDEYVPDVEHQALWAQAGSIQELGELTARWMTGEISYQPGYWSTEPDPETRELVPVLAELNRAGFVTDFSQPGVALDPDGDGQRASVSGFCSAATAARLQEALCRTELVYLADEAGEAGGVSLVVTTYDGQECTWLGRGPDLDHYGEDLSPELFVRLVEAVYLVVVDPRWGRNDLLWSTLRTALVDTADAGAR